MAWSAKRIGDLSGVKAIVTGANSGIGLEATRELLRHGAHVILACRTPSKAESALKGLERDVPNCQAEMMQLDLASLASIERFAGEVSGPLDLLINNAGVMAIPRRETEDGFEMQIGTNHLGHFALTGRLLPRILEAAAAGKRPRVVTVSSQAHRIGILNLDDIHGARSYDKWAAYGQSKLANLLFMQELAKRFEAHAVSALSVACHPGYASTNLQAVGPNMEGSTLFKRLTDVGNVLFAQSAASGALPTLYAACGDDIENGDYAGPRGPAEFWGKPKKTRGNTESQDPNAMRGLWELSERLTGVSYSFG
ncbi:MAG: SDR family NAD(P)-dependent oxidoreductase [Polyangiaceae bacterium]|nr:SDR family NAD(P)-dependent oxidoreductase [Myxococcales bacterium]MCB9590082.1 SDR family NAD(P)-dependent oxidoreductase [Polyangiaceae bacterium]MCB9607961.1 SDR family NAD(P)-dependent oxidoreductase [Polyangiaceae bacterium]